jgi:hypothetical protein
MTNPYIMLAANDVNGYYQNLFPNAGGWISAIIILIIGIILSFEISKVVKIAAQKAGLDEVFERAGVKKFFGRAEAKILLSHLLAWIVKWFLLLFFITAAVNSLGLPQVSQFLTQILYYLPNLVVALAILTLGLLIAQMVYEALEGMSQAAGIEIYHLAAVGAKALIIIITILVILQQIGIQTTIIQIFAAGFALMIGLAGGIAFGLGGQNLAKELLEDMRNKLRKQ